MTRLRLLRAGDGDGSVEGGAARTARARCRVAHGVALSMCRSCLAYDLNYHVTAVAVLVVVVADVDGVARLVIRRLLGLYGGCGCCGCGRLT